MKKIIINRKVNFNFLFQKIFIYTQKKKKVGRINQDLKIKKLLIQKERKKLYKQKSKRINLL